MVQRLIIFFSTYENVYNVKNIGINIIQRYPSFAKKKALLMVLAVYIKIYEKNQRPVENERHEKNRFCKLFLFELKTKNENMKSERELIISGTINIMQR